MSWLPRGDTPSKPITPLPDAKGCHRPLSKGAALEPNGYSVSLSLSRDRGAGKRPVPTPRARARTRGSRQVSDSHRGFAP